VKNFLFLLVLASAPAAQLTIPPANAGNMTECYNSDGDGTECNADQHRSGSWITGDSDGIEEVVFTDGPGGRTVIATGAYLTHIVDYRVQFNQGDEACGVEPVVETPHHAPYVLEFSRWFRSRASYVDYGLTQGWTDNLTYLFAISTVGPNRHARFETPNGTTMDWIDVGSTGTWIEDNVQMQSMELTLVEEPGDRYLVTDRWGGKYHFMPAVGSRANLPYLLDWMEDENGNRITVTYDGAGYPTQSADGFGRILRYFWSVGTFGGTRHLVRVQRPDGVNLDLKYYLNGVQSYDVTYPNGDKATYGKTSDADGAFYYFNDPLGAPGGRKDRVYTYYDGTFDTGRVRGVKDESGAVRYVRREDPLDAKITIEYLDGRASAYDCIEAGLNERITNLRTGAVTVKEWEHASDLLLSRTDALGNFTGFDYDYPRQLRTRRTHNGVPETWSYGATNRVTDHVDRNGNVTHHDRDALGNLLRRTFADGTYHEWTRGARGEPLTFRNRNGKITSYSYDARGNVAQIIRPAQLLEANPVVAFTYDVNGRVLTSTDPMGNVTTFAYDSLGRRVTTTYPDLTSETSVYGSMDLGSSSDPVDTAGQVVRRVDRNGHATDLSFGDNDRLASESGAPGLVTYQYDAQGRLVGRVVNGDAEAYGYDAAVRRTSLARTVDATTTQTTIFYYDLLDRVVAENDPHDFVTTRTYDGFGRVVLEARQILGAFYAATGFTYDANGNVLTRTENGHTRTFVLDTNGRVLEDHDPAPFQANFLAYSYDGEGNLLSETDQLGNTRSFTYTNRGMLQSETDPTGLVISRSYYLDDACKEIKNLGTGGRTLFVYSGGGNQSGSTLEVDGGANDVVVNRVLDGNGNLIQETDGEGKVRQREYDARNRLVRAIDPLGQTTDTTYSDDGAPFDARLAAGQGRAETVTDALGNATTTVYDGIGRVIRVIDARGASTVFWHAPDDGIFGNPTVTRRDDRLGKTWIEYFDGLGRKVRAVDPLGNETRWFFDADGNLLRLLDARGISYVHEYDTLGRRIHDDYPGDDVYYSYAANGWLVSILDENSDTTTFAYDAAGRLLTKTYDDGRVDTFGYDAGGRLNSATSGLYLNTVEFEHDKADRVVREFGTREVLISYDRRSLATSITTPSGRVIERTYTDRGELDTVSVAGNLVSDDAYDAAGNLVQRQHGNGASSAWTHDANGRTETIEHFRAADEILRLAYTYDAEGRKLARRNRTNVSRNEFYLYDDAGQLVVYRGKVPPVRQAPPGTLDPLKGATRSQTWTLDPVGNWSETVRNALTPEVRLHNVDSELFKLGSRNLTYDKRGNLIDDQIRTYEYDFNDRLVTVHETASGDIEAEYSYDALGRRITRTALEKVTITQRRFLYFYAGDEIVEIRERPTVHDPDQFLAAIAHGSQPDEVLAMVRSANTFYYHHDAARSTMALTRFDGDIVERYEYDPYGKTQVMEATWQPIGDLSSHGNVFTFQGQEADAESGLLYFGTRSLQPFLGRFLQRHPEGIVHGTNVYDAARLVNGSMPDSR
jgi:RHS repeat-associated protein